MNDNVEVVEELIGHRGAQGRITAERPWGVPETKIKHEESTSTQENQEEGANTQHVDDDDGIRRAQLRGAPEENSPTPLEVERIPSEDESDDEIQVQERIRPPPLVAEVVEVESESEAEEEESNREPPPSSHRYGLRKRLASNNQAGIGTPAASVSFQKFDDEDSSDDESGPEKKQKLGLKRIDNVDAVMKKFKRSPDLVDSYNKCIIEPTANRSNWMLPFCMKYGSGLEELTLTSWVWRPINSNTVDENEHGQTNLAVVLKYCKNLTSLKLWRPVPENIGTFTGLGLTLTNLKHLIYDCKYEEYEEDLTTECQARLEKMFTVVFKGAINLETFQCTVSKRENIHHILEALKSVSFEGDHLKKLTTLKIIYSDKDEYDGDDEPAILNALDIQSLADMKLKLKHLVLGVALGEDVRSEIFQKFLAAYSKLTELNIQGTFQGTDTTKPIVVHFPLMSQLVKLSIGGEYKFSTRVESSMSTNRKIVSIEDKVGLLKLQLKLPMLPNLESIRLGSLANVDNLTPQYLPKLKSLRIGGPWNLSLDFLKPNLVFPNVTELQFPDGLKDPSFSARIPTIFPNLKKAWIYLPTAKTLKSFVREVQTVGGPLLEELYLKTQFDFESTLESVILKSSSESEVEMTALDKVKVKAINRYKYKDEFVDYFNIELPEDSDSNDYLNYPGLGVFKTLKILIIEHIPRVIRIPEGEYRWYDARCSFSGQVIGFDKFPLNEACLEELPSKSLNVLQWPNFQVDDRDTWVLEGFESCGMNHVQAISKALSAKNKDGRGALKVTLEPNMVRFAPFKAKSE